MPLASPLRTFKVDQAVVEVYASQVEAGRAAAEQVSTLLKAAIAKAAGHVRWIMATGNSQQEMFAPLVETPGIDWSRLEMFHMDEYIGLPDTHRGSLRRWMNTHFVNVVHPGTVQYLDGQAADLVAECRRYEQILRSAPIRLCTLGIGENGHIAFNDPHVADFQDPLGVKCVTLDERDRHQQANEGHFVGFSDVPSEAVTITCPLLMSAETLICSVPELRKAEAVKNALEGPISTQCPGSILRTHPRVTLYLDKDSASLLTI